MLCPLLVSLGDAGSLCQDANALDEEITPDTFCEEIPASKSSPITLFAKNTGLKIKSDHGWSGQEADDFLSRTEIVGLIFAVKPNFNGYSRWR